MIKLGLCPRHEIFGISNYIFPESIDPIDIEKLNQEAYVSIVELLKTVDTEDYDGGIHIDLYVTGSKIALTAALNAVRQLGATVTLYHYNKKTRQYYPQQVL